MDTQPEGLLFTFGAQIFFKVFFCIVTAQELAGHQNRTRRTQPGEARKGSPSHLEPRFSSRCFFCIVTSQELAGPQNGARRTPGVARKGSSSHLEPRISSRCFYCIVRSHELADLQTRARRTQPGEARTRSSPER